MKSLRWGLVVVAMVAAGAGTLAEIGSKGERKQLIFGRNDEQIRKLQPKYDDIDQFLQPLIRKRNQLQRRGLPLDVQAQFDEADYMSDLFTSELPIAHLLGEPQMRLPPPQLPTDPGVLGDNMQSGQGISQPESSPFTDYFGNDMQSEQGTSNFEFSVNNDVDAMPMPPSSVSVAPQRRENLGPRRNNYNGPPEDDEKHGAPNL
jgi:hypothetical protein